MQIFLVGGAIRDEFLGLPVGERDWCVTGATPEDMVALGYRPVGKDFPVFLHPDTNEEYALARTERKTAAGYHGFDFNTSPEVSIEEDLGRRDLTINAIAKDDAGNIIDPFNGRTDLNERILRHVSDAFVEDPVRVLRVARFAARFYPLGFRVAAETRDCMRRIVEDGEMDALVPDRVWQETQKALAGNHSRVYFETLRDCGALAVVFPEVDALFGIPQPERWHPEIDTGIHTMMVLDAAEKLSDALPVRFAALVHDLGKATTDKARLPSHPGHEQRSARLIRQMADRLPIPRDCIGLALLVAEYHTHCHRALELKHETLLKVLERTDAFRRPRRFEDFLTACEADARGRKGLEDRDYPQADRFRRALQAANSVDAGAIAGEHSGDAIPRAIREARRGAIREAV